MTVKTSAVISELRERVHANMLWKLGYHMRPSRSLSGFLSWGYKLHRQAFHTLAVFFYFNCFLLFPSLPVKISMNTADGIWCLWKAYQQFIDSIFWGCFTCCCDRNAWDSCKQSWVRNQNYNFSCSFSSSFNHCCIHHLAWIGSNFPVWVFQTVKEKRKWIVRGR